MAGRILCVTSNFPRWEGDSTTPFVLHLAQDLQELGWRVDVLAPHAPGTSPREILGEVHVERFRYLWPANLETVCYQGGALINLRRNRGNLLKLPALVIAEWFAVLRRLAGRHYDLLHSHWILPQGFTGAMAAGPLRIPHVLTAHGGDVFALRGGVLTAFKRFALKNADAVTVNSSATQRAVESIAPGLVNLHRVPMGVTIHSMPKEDPVVVEIRNRYRRGNGPLLLFVGRVVHEKGIEDFLQAVGRLSDLMPEVTGVIVGEGQDRPELQARAGAMGLADRVTFTGWIPSERVPAFLSAADVFVGPSRQAKDGWVEAQGLTFLEAMIARTPVVATRVGGIVDSVRDGQTGLLVDEQAPEQIAQAVLRLFREPGLAATLVENGFRLAATEFSREATALSFAELFAKLISKRTRNPS